MKQKVRFILNQFLYNILEEILTPIREKRAYYENHLDLVYKMLEDGSKKARMVAIETLKEVRNAIGVNYFDE